MAECMSTVLLNLMVSNTTIVARTIETVKMLESHPSINPTDNINAVTKAQCELGIPPAEMNLTSCNSLYFIEYKTTFSN